MNKLKLFFSTAKQTYQTAKTAVRQYLTTKAGVATVAGATVGTAAVVGTSVVTSNQNKKQKNTSKYLSEMTELDDELTQKLSGARNPEIDAVIEKSQDPNAVLTDEEKALLTKTVAIEQVSKVIVSLASLLQMDELDVLQIFRDQIPYNCYRVPVDDRHALQKNLILGLSCNNPAKIACFYHLGRLFGDYLDNAEFMTAAINAAVIGIYTSQYGIALMPNDIEKLMSRILRDCKSGDIGNYATQSGLFDSPENALNYLDAKSSLLGLRWQLDI